MLSQDIRSWLVRYGELVTLTQRVLRECGGVCASLSLRYLIIVLGVELNNFCRYVTTGLGSGLSGNCVDVMRGLGVKEDLVSSLAELLTVSKALAEGVDVGDDVLTTLVGRLPESYALLSRTVFQGVIGGYG